MTRSASKTLVENDVNMWKTEQHRTKTLPEAQGWEQNLAASLSAPLDLPCRVNNNKPHESAMAPIRRYLRITKYSVLECRIYVDNPALAESWLLNSRNPVLPRVIESVRPLVLPKLREENERSRGKGGKKKGVKDVVVEGMHELLYLQKGTC